MDERIRWGILSTGAIAKSFVKGLAAVGDAEPVAVGSRTQAAADAFGDEFGISRRHPSYEALANDPDVDVIYVATPHTLPQGEQHPLSQGGESGPVREALHHQSTGSRGTRCRCARGRPLSDGGHVDPLPADHVFRCESGWRKARSATSGWSRRTSGSGRVPAARSHASMTLLWAAVR